MNDNIKTVEQTSAAAVVDASKAIGDGTKNAAEAAKVAGETLSNQALTEGIKGAAGGRAGAEMSVKEVEQELMKKGWKQVPLSDAKPADSILKPAVKDGQQTSPRNTNGLPTVDLHDPNSAKMGKGDSNLINELKQGSSSITDKIIQGDKIGQSIKDLFKPKDGVEQLSTGDYLVRDEGKQSLFTPNRDHITINPDGTHEIKGDIRKTSTDKNGVTTVEFADGASVSFDKEGFLSVQRGNEGVAFSRKSHEPFHKSQGIEGAEPDPFHKNPRIEIPKTEPFRRTPRIEVPGTDPSTGKQNDSTIKDKSKH